jgi:hypothetical protein
MERKAYLLLPKAITLSSKSPTFLPHLTLLALPIRSRRFEQRLFFLIILLQRLQDLKAKLEQKQ